MKQQNPPLHSSVSVWHINVDGAARNNPGPAGIGIYMLRNNEVVEQKGFFIGSKTNNQAEYLALLVALYYLRWHADPGATVIINSDSELLVRQIKGIYKIKNQGLKPLYTLAIKWLYLFDCTLMHVIREDNTIADMLANIAIDKKLSLPNDIVQQLEKEGVAI